MTNANENIDNTRSKGDSSKPDNDTSESDSSTSESDSGNSDISFDWPDTPSPIEDERAVVPSHMHGCGSINRSYRQFSGEAFRRNITAKQARKLNTIPRQKAADKKKNPPTVSRSRKQAATSAPPAESRTRQQAASLATPAGSRRGVVKKPPKPRDLQQARASLRRPHASPPQVVTHLGDQQPSRPLLLQWQSPVTPAQLQQTEPLAPHGLNSPENLNQPQPMTRVPHSASYPAGRLVQHQPYGSQNYSMNYSSYLPANRNLNSSGFQQALYGIGCDQSWRDPRFRNPWSMAPPLSPSERQPNHVIESGNYEQIYNRNFTPLNLQLFSRGQNPGNSSAPPGSINPRGH